MVDVNSHEVSSDCEFGAVYSHRPQGCCQWRFGGHCHLQYCDLRRWVNIGSWLQLLSVLMLILSFACTLCSILSFPFSFPCNSNGRSVVHADWKSAITKGTWALSLWIGSTSMLEIVDGQFWWKNLKRDSGFFLLLDNFYFEQLLDSCLMNTVFLVKTLLNS